MAVPKQATDPRACKKIRSPERCSILWAFGSEWGKPSAWTDQILGKVNSRSLSGGDLFMIANSIVSTATVTGGPPEQIFITGTPFASDLPVQPETEPDDAR